ncbi:MAG: response regulator [Gammaproteobacteria bacterium]|nr:response regulator [Gammaproteobacteria bacterium]
MSSKNSSKVSKDVLLSSSQRDAEALKIVHEALHSGMWSMTFNEESKMVSCTWSDEFRKMIGFNDENDFPNELNSWSDRLHKDDKDRIINEYIETINDRSGKKTYDVEYRLLTNWGEYRWYHAAGRLRRREDGTPIEYIGIFIDITEKKERQRQLEEALEEARAANKAKSEFLSNMSHDIRTPMNAIVGMSVIAMDHKDDPDRVEDCLRKISISSKHLLGLINDVLDMAKIESGKLTLNPDNVSLKKITEAICDIIRPQVRQAKQHFNISIGNIISEQVYLDSTRLNQVLLNFLSNSVKFTGEGGHINVEIYQEESPKGSEFVRCHFIVKDDGIGMSKEFQKKLFKSFEREDNKRIQKTQGTGLGMAISKHIIDAMEGEILVDSELGVGTTFHVIIDLEKIEVDDAHMKLPGMKILVVDDNENLCDTILYTIEQLDAIGEAVNSGAEAIEKVKNNDYFAILVDYKMPKMNGVETIKEIRKILGDKKPVCLISAYEWDEFEKEAMDAGASGFIPKPLFKSTLYHELIKFTEGYNKQKFVKERVDLAGLKILLAEDQFINAEIMRSLLEDRNAIIDVAEDGKIAFDMFSSSKENYYNVILMDLRMPNMNGFEATEAIRALNRKDAKKIPIIALTADAFAEDAKKCLDVGMNAHLSKPVDIELLEKTLAKLM